MTKAPPQALIAAVNAIRGGIQRIRQSTVPASVAVLELGFGAWVAQALYAAVRLGIPDALKSGPLTADQVAATVGADPAATYPSKALFRHTISAAAS